MSRFVDSIRYSTERELFEGIRNFLSLSLFILFIQYSKVKYWQELLIIGLVFVVVVVVVAVAVAGCAPRCASVFVPALFFLPPFIGIGRYRHISITVNIDACLLDSYD